MNKRGLFLGIIMALGLPVPASAATLTLDFDVSFGDPLDADTVAPDGPAPWLTAFFDDGNSPGSVDLTLSVSAGVGSAEVTQVYLNVDDAIGGGNLTITPTGGTGPSPTISQGTDAYKADADGWFDLLFEMPVTAGLTFDAGETLTFSITGDPNLVASSFNYWSTPDQVDPNGPFLGAAKFTSTGECVIENGECTYPGSDWVGAVPVPAAVWLFGSGLLGLAGVAKRRRAKA
jgi:hypothetical protein